MQEQEIVSGEVVSDIQDAGLSVNEMLLSKNIAAAICQKYPIEQGHKWGIHVNAPQGVCYIYNFNLSSKWGFTLKLADLVNDPKFKKAVAAAGEILERYNVHRSRVRGIEDDLGIMATDFTGENCFDGHCALKFGRSVESKVVLHGRSKGLNVAKDRTPPPLVFR